MSCLQSASLALPWWCASTCIGFHIFSTVSLWWRRWSSFRYHMKISLVSFAYYTLHRGCAACTVLPVMTFETFASSNGDLIIWYRMVWSLGFCCGILCILRMGEGALVSIPILWFLYIYYITQSFWISLVIWLLIIVNLPARNIFELEFVVNCSMWQWIKCGIDDQLLSLHKMPQAEKVKERGD